MNILNADMKSNYHTHTYLDDGRDSADEMVRKAIDLGFTTIGFSGHEEAFDEPWCMTPERTEHYRKEVLEAKEKYKGKIKVMLGIERDYFSPKCDYHYDYVIGSVHCVKADGKFLAVDETAEVMEENVREHFGGDYMAYVKSYYDLVAEVVEKTGCDIVGHFDLVTKFNEGSKYFDEESTEYKRIALRALAKASVRRPIIEINTGAVARGYRTRPYPPKFIIEEADRLGCPFLLASDCHDREKLDFDFRKIMSEFDTI